MPCVYKHSKPGSNSRGQEGLVEIEVDITAETAAKALAVVENNLQYEVSLATAQQRPKVLTIQVGILSRYSISVIGIHTILSVNLSYISNP